jgi:hypothetical protein
MRRAVQLRQSFGGREQENFYGRNDDVILVP